jgi:hypothetical protein
MLILFKLAKKRKKHVQTLYQIFTIVCIMNRDIQKIARKFTIILITQLNILGWEFSLIEELFDLLGPDLRIKKLLA